MLNVQVYRGTWNHTDIAAKQYLPHVPSSNDGQTGSPDEAAKAVAAAQVGDND